MKRMTNKEYTERGLTTKVAPHTFRSMGWAGVDWGARCGCNRWDW